MWAEGMEGKSGDSWTEYGGIDVVPDGIGIFPIGTFQPGGAPAVLTPGTAFNPTASSNVGAKMENIEWMEVLVYSFSLTFILRCRWMCIRRCISWWSCLMKAFIRVRHNWLKVDRRSYELSAKRRLNRRRIHNQWIWSNHDGWCQHNVKVTTFRPGFNLQFIRNRYHVAPQSIWVRNRIGNG